MVRAIGPRRFRVIVMVFIRKLAAWGMVSLVALGSGCAQPERKVEKKKKNIRVRAPYTSVDIEIPEDDDDDVDVNVHVDR